MFKKIISQLSLSPATVERLGVYAADLRKKQRYIAIAAALAWALTFISIILLLFPPTPPSLQTANDLIPGGVTSPEAIVSAYDNNVNSFRSTADLLGITRNALTQLHECHPDLPYVTAKTPYGTPEEQTYRPAEGAPFYMRERPTKISEPAWCDNANTTPSFAITTRDGNIQTANPLQPQGAYSPNYAHTVAVSGDTFTWTLTTKNESDTPLTEDIYFPVGDITEYATITTTSQAGITSEVYDYIMWPSVTLDPGQQQDFVVTAHLNRPVDETTRQPHNTHSYDCQITTAFGNTTNTAIPCPLMKQLESVFYVLPPINSLFSAAVYGLIAAIATFSYYSLRIQSKEIRIIRMQLNSGGF